MFQSAPPPAGGRPGGEARETRRAPFQSAPPRGGATERALTRVDAEIVSIRAPPAGGRLAWTREIRVIEGFNPRPPAGGRRP